MTAKDRQRRYQQRLKRDALIVQSEINLGMVEKMIEHGFLSENESENRIEIGKTVVQLACERLDEKNQ